MAKHLTLQPLELQAVQRALTATLSDPGVAKLVHGDSASIKAAQRARLKAEWTQDSKKGAGE